MPEVVAEASRTEGSSHRWRGVHEGRPVPSGEHSRNAVLPLGVKIPAGWRDSLEHTITLMTI